MEFAINELGVKTHASTADKRQFYYCPVCRQKVIPRQGNVNIDHFAHVSKCDDHWNYDMSEWHSQWQKQFPQKNQEVVVEVEGIKHRADVMACGYVIEFQHSSITAEEFNERNNFYLSYGKKVVWIFDFSDEMESGNVDCYDEYKGKYGNGGKFSWKYAKRIFRNFLPQADRAL